VNRHGGGGGGGGGADWPALAHRLWRSSSARARLARTALLSAAALYRTGTVLRNAVYDWRVLRSWRLPMASLGVGNLAVGGVGKTPIASYLARELVRRGAKPGILLRGYAGGDEAVEHRARAPEAVVVADRHRRRGAARAIAAGAEVLVLDDCLQHREVRPDVLVAILAAETAGEPMWPLPAGPWREGLGALARCDAVLVTHRTAPAAEAAAVAARLGPRTRSRLGVAAGLEIARLVPLNEGAALPPGWLEGREVVAVSGIGEPRLFALQLERLGARVRALAFGDHHRYTAADAARIVARATSAAAVVTKAKDAVRLRPVWPPAAPTCLVAELEVRVTQGQEDMTRLLDRFGRAALRHQTPLAATAPREQRNTP
jgi:tetraacyldisaccharide 4'-kinase